MSKQIQDFRCQICFQSPGKARFSNGTATFPRPHVISRFVIPSALALSLGITCQIGCTISSGLRCISTFRCLRLHSYVCVYIYIYIYIYHSYDIFVSGDSRIWCVSSLKLPTYCVTDFVAMTQEFEGLVKPKRCLTDWDRNSSTVVGMARS